MGKYFTVRPKTDSEAAKLMAKIMEKILDHQLEEHPEELEKIKKELAEADATEPRSGA